MVNKKDNQEDDSREEEMEAGHEAEEDSHMVESEPTSRQGDTRSAALPFSTTIRPNHASLPSNGIDAHLGKSRSEPRSGIEKRFGTTSIDFGAPSNLGQQVRRPSATPSLTIDTDAASQASRRNELYPRSPLSPPSPLSQASVSPVGKLPKLPPSPRTRERGFSLRRSILTKSTSGPPSMGHGSVIELESIGSSSNQADAIQQTGSGQGDSKLKSVSIVISPIAEDTDGEHTIRQGKKPFSGNISLPNYESWVNQRSSAGKIWKRIHDLRKKVRKTLLRIQELPPSRNGRHIPLDLSRRKPLIDERRGQAYISNTICSTRHTVYNFVPRQLFFQFYKLANFYFLCVSILQMIPGLSTTGTFTTIVPLLFFVSVSIAKEGYDDLRRHRLDKAENRKEASVLHAYNAMEGKSLSGSTDESFEIQGVRHWAKVKWENVKVGDVVRLERDEACPADLVMLHAEGTEGVAYIETMALDGETNLKSKTPSPLLAKACQTTAAIARCRAEMVTEDPNLDLYNFDGKVTIEDESLPLTNNEIVYRGSVLRNTQECIGMVLYTGEECKIRMNATKNPRIKAPALQFAVNRVVVIIVIFVVVLAIFNTVAYQIWSENTEEISWYLTNAGVGFVPILASFIILFNTMIPLSLYVSLEIVKLCQMLLMSDIDMYDEASNTPMEARTSTINEELGQVNYIFSDKTGTLTNNNMMFRKMSVAGTAWLHDFDIQQTCADIVSIKSLPSRKRSKGKKVMRNSIEPRQSYASVQSMEDPRPSQSTIGRNDSVKSVWRSSARRQSTQRVRNTTELLLYVQTHPDTIFARKIQFFILSLALCHTAFPETRDGEAITYQAASPDEQALVRAAQELGYIVTDRQNGIITVKTKNEDDEPQFSEYQVLDVIEFSSARKRMSIVVRMPDQRICVFCKGADTTISQLLRLSKLANAKAAEIEQRATQRQSLEAHEALRRASEAKGRKDSIARKSISLSRPSLSGVGRPSIGTKHMQPIRDEIDQWLNERERDVEFSSVDNESTYLTPRPSTQLNTAVDRATHSFDGLTSPRFPNTFEMVDEASVIDDSFVFERCFQHINDFATEGLRTLLYSFRFLDEQEYRSWKKLYHDATTSLENRQEKVEKAGAMIEHDFELAGATAIEDKLQDGVPETIDKLRRAGIKLWMLTGDKRETAINIGHSCRLIKDYSTVTILDRELGDVSQRMAAGIVDINSGLVAHSVVVVDGQTLTEINSNDHLRKLFLSLTILVDTVVCCRASPSQKASLVHSIRRKVKHAITLAIGDGANDIAMIQEAHVGIGITGKEGLQAARTSDYSIAQFRFLQKLLLVHGRWNYIRVCKYTLATFWKEMFFYLTQALYQRYAGYTGTSLYESWSLSMFNTLFTSLPVIFIGIFEQDLSARILMAVPELYQSEGPRNAGFNIKKYLWWVFMASSNSVIVFFIMLGLYGQALFTLDNGLFAMGQLSFTACIIIINIKIQFFELFHKTVMCAIALFCSIGGWFLWNIILSATYHDNKIYNVKDGFLDRFGRNSLWWLTLILILSASWALEIGIKTAKTTWMPSDVDTFRELEKDELIRRRFAQASGLPSLERELHNDEPENIENALRRVRSPEEERERAHEVEEMLKRPRHLKTTNVSDETVPTSEAIRRRKTLEEEPTIRSPKVSFAATHREHIYGEMQTQEEEEEEDDDNGKPKGRRRSVEVSEIFKRGFGSVRRSLDIV